MSHTWEQSASQTGTFARSHLSGQNQVMGRLTFAAYITAPAPPTTVTAPHGSK